MLTVRLGLRVDGRRPPELRKLQCKLGVFHQADGSAFLEQGNTKVLATVYGPHDVRPHYSYSIIVHWQEVSGYFMLALFFR